MIIDQTEFANWAAALFASLKVVTIHFFENLLALLTRIVFKVNLSFHIYIECLESWCVYA